MCGAFSGIVIAALKTDTQNEHNTNETLSLSDDMVSWLGTTIFYLKKVIKFIANYIFR